MRASLCRVVIIVGIATVVLPRPGSAQEAALSGTISDSTGGVLPGVTITALHEATGNNFVVVTDERGGYRLALRIGAYKLLVELAGFTTISRSGLELQVGQSAVVNLQMVPSAVEQLVTVRADAPLLDFARSTLASNVDQRQMQDLPLNGRNWMDLTMLAPGSRLNASTTDVINPGAGSYQVNLDGQQVSQWSAPGFGQARYSRDAIAEFEFVASRFSATQGRSSGVQVNAITKSGTNLFAETFAGYFRDDRFNAADVVAKRVLPYSDQQLSGTVGGPIRKDRLHFFANYEYEREPQTFSYTTPYPRFNQDISGTRTNKLGGGRVDAQFTPSARLAVRGAKFRQVIPYSNQGGGAGVHPSELIGPYDQFSTDVAGTLTQVLSPRVVNEVKVGFNGFKWTQVSPVSWPSGPAALNGYGAPRITFRGYSIGQGNTQAPQSLDQKNYSFRNDLTLSMAGLGRHDVKLGGEFLLMRFDHFLCSNCVGLIDAQGGAIPANIEDLFPVWNDVSTWNLAALSPIVRQYTQGIGNFDIESPRDVFAGWVQDDWTLTPRLTVNLGLRYDFADGLFAEDVDLPPFLTPGRPNDKNNIAPRLGFAFTASEQTVIRGGWGRYFAEVTDQPTLFSVSASKVMSVTVLNDGRPDFASNPFNGPTPTFDQAVALWKAGRFQRNAGSSIADPAAEVPYSWQGSVGLQHQFSGTMSFDADYAFTLSRKTLNSTRNVNLTYDPATGVNVPFQDISRRPYPEWGLVTVRAGDGFDNYHALQTSFTKRMSNRWQAAATYTLARTYQGDPQPLNTILDCEYPMTSAGQCSTPFAVAKDLGGDSYWTGWTNRAVFNGIVDAGYGFQLSGLYFYRNGVLSQSTYGADVRQTGVTGAAGRLRPDGTVVPRNNFQEEPLHRLDMRLQRRFGVGGRRSVDGILELFNAFNHANYGSYVTQESARNYGQPLQSTNIAYQPRVWQLGFRVSF